MNLPTPIADVIDDIQTAQATLTENARAAARLTLRVPNGEDALTLAQLRDTTADAVRRLERARLTLLPQLRQEEQMNKNALAEQAERIARRGSLVGGAQTRSTVQQLKARRDNRWRAIAILTICFLGLGGIVALASLLARL